MPFQVIDQYPILSPRQQREAQAVRQAHARAQAQSYIHGQTYTQHVPIPNKSSPRLQYHKTPSVPLDSAAAHPLPRNPSLHTLASVRRYRTPAMINYASQCHDMTRSQLEQERIRIRNHSDPRIWNATLEPIVMGMGMGIGMAGSIKHKHISTRDITPRVDTGLISLRTMAAEAKRISLPSRNRDLIPLSASPSTSTITPSTVNLDAPISMSTAAKTIKRPILSIPMYDVTDQTLPSPYALETPSEPHSTIFDIPPHQPDAQANPPMHITIEEHVTIMSSIPAAARSSCGTPRTSSPVPPSSSTSHRSLPHHMTPYQQQQAHRNHTRGPSLWDPQDGKVMPSDDNTPYDSLPEAFDPENQDER